MLIDGRESILCYACGHHELKERETMVQTNEERTDQTRAEKLGGMIPTEQRLRASESIPKQKKRTLDDWLKRDGANASIRTNARTVTIELSIEVFTREIGTRRLEIERSVSRAEVGAALFRVIDFAIDLAIIEIEIEINREFKSE